MSRSLRRVFLRAVLAGIAIAAAAPAGAWAHASLLATAPAAQRVAPHAPDELALTFSEAVEPRFAVISITDVKGRQLGTGAPTRSTADPRTIERRLAHLRPGWYLAYWRVISADGHPVRGAFTFAVGPGPGTPKQFAIPSLKETAATPGLIAARWGAMLSMMARDRPVPVPLRHRAARRGDGGGPVAARGDRRDFACALAAALVLVPVYLLLSTAKFATLAVTDVGALLPLVRISSFGRGISDLEVLLALFGVAAGVAIWLDRPDRARRSVVELLALGAAISCAAAILVVPGLAGHAAQTSPRALAMALDWIHLAAGSVWLGGLVGLLVLWGRRAPGAPAARARDRRRRGSRAPRSPPCSRSWRPGPRRPSCSCRRSARCGRPATAARSS